MTERQLLAKVELQGLCDAMEFLERNLPAVLLTGSPYAHAADYSLPTGRTLRFTLRLEDVKP